MKIKDKKSYLQDYDKCLDRRPLVFHPLSLIHKSQKFNFDVQRRALFNLAFKLDKNPIQNQNFYKQFLNTYEWINYLSGCHYIDESIQIAQQLYEQSNQQDIQACYSLLRIYQRQDYNDKLVEYTDKCLQIDPNYSKALYFKAYIEEVKGNIEEAQQMFEKIIENHEIVNAYISLVNIYLQKDLNKAFEYCNIVKEKFPEEYFIYIYEGNYYAFQGESENAITCYNKLIEQEKYSFPPIYFHLANIYQYKFKNIPKSIQLYKDGIMNTNCLIDDIDNKKISNFVEKKIQNQVNLKNSKIKTLYSLYVLKNSLLYTSLFRKEINYEISTFLNNKSQFEWKKDTQITYKDSKKQINEIQVANQYIIQ